jgi:hypothetical protein
VTAAIARGDVRFLALVARLPFASTRHLAVLSGEPSSALVYRRASRLLERALLAWVAGPSTSGAGRSPRLLYPTEFGLRLLASEAGVDPVVLARELGLGRPGLTRRLAGLPALLASYELLTRLAAVGAGTVNLQVWERPWRRTYQLPRHRRPQLARVPASTELTWTRPQTEQAVCGRFLLIPDTGGLAIPSFRVQLGRLIDLQRATGERLPVLVVATTSVARVRAWSRLVEQVSQARGWRPLEVNVTTWAAVGQDTQSSGWSSVYTRVEKSARAPWLAVDRTVHGRAAPNSSDRHPPTIGIRLPASALAETPLNVSERAVLDLVGRHPFLPPAVLGDVLGRDARWVARRRKALLDRGLLRLVTPGEVHRSGLARGDLLELTSAGLRTLAAHLGLSLASAVAHHGLAGGGPETPIGTRRILLAYLDHTVGADGVFGVLARAARSRRDCALVEWRNAAACAHGRLRPDGYGVLRLWQRDYGFFLEFDRGTVRPAPLRAKFAAYYRYLASARAAKDFDGPPSVLVVTAGPSAEDRVVDAVLAAEVGQPWRLPLLLTTMDLLTTAEHGPFDCVWRILGVHNDRRAWPGPSRSRDEPRPE